nr:unnamed protein product [Callosobruchus chinensis]
MLRAQSLHKLLVHRLVTVFRQHAKHSLPLVQGFGSFVETVNDTVMNQGSFQHLLQGLVDVHRPSGLNWGHGGVISTKNNVILLYLVFS